jgi:hypothetical protein
MPTRSKVKTSFFLHEVVLLSGFSKYMLDYLTREDIFVPSIEKRTDRGVRREYSYADVVLLRALRTICAGRGKVAYLKQALKAFREEFGTIKPGQRIDKKLFLLGNRLHVYTPREGARALGSGQLTLAFVVDLPFISGAMAACVIPGPSPGSFDLTPQAKEAAEAIRQQIWAPIRARRAAA